MIKWIKARRQKKADAMKKARLIRDAKIRGAVIQAQQKVTEDMQFIEDIGQQKKRKEMVLSDREIQEKADDITMRIFGQVGILTVLSMLQKERDAADRLIKKGKRLPVQEEAEALIKELFK